MNTTACTQCWGYDDVHPCICSSPTPADEPTNAVDSTGVRLRDDDQRVAVLWQRIVAGLT